MTGRDDSSDSLDHVSPSAPQLVHGRKRQRRTLDSNGTLHKTVRSSVCRRRPRQTRYSWKQKEWGVGGVATLIWFTFKRVSSYTRRFRQALPTTRWYHNVCPSWGRVSFFSTARGSTQKVTDSSGLVQRKGNSCGGRAAREAVTFSLYEAD